MGLASAVAGGPVVDSMQSMQGLMESEFAFQNGAFTEAFSYYKLRPIDSLSQTEQIRATQFALVTGDAGWLQQLLNSPIGQSSTHQELLALQLEMAFQHEQAHRVQQAWQLLLLSTESNGSLVAREIIFRQPVDHKNTLNEALELYAKQKKLTDIELFELFQFSIQQQLPALATSLKNRLSVGSKLLAMAKLIDVCETQPTTECAHSIEQLNPIDYTESQQRRVYELARQSGNLEQAMRWLLALPQDSNTYYQRIVILNQTVDQTKVKELAAVVANDGQLNAFQRAVLLGSLAELKKDWPAAESYYREALLLKIPTTAVIRLAIVLIRQNKFEQAFSWLSQIQQDASFSDEIRRDAFITEIQFHRLKPDQQQSKSIVNIYQQALKLWPHANRLRYQYAMYLFANHQQKQALKELTTILKTAPADANVLNTYGYLLAKDFNRPRAAFEPIEQAYFIAPDQAEILDSYGYVLSRLGRHSEALAPLQRAWQLTPTAVTAGHLARVYWQLGDKVQANDYLQKGLKLDKNEVELLQFKELLP